MNAPSYQQETGLIHHRLHSKMADSFLSVQVSLPLRVGDRIRSIDVCFFFLMAPQDLTEDGLQRGLCDFYCIWDLYQQYLVNEQQMLNRRTALLVNYENANRNWDKAKAHKKDEVKKSFIIHSDAIHAISRTPISCVVCRFFDCTIPSVRSPSQRHFP